MSIDYAALMLLLTCEVQSKSLRINEEFTLSSAYRGFRRELIVTIVASETDYP